MLPFQCSIEHCSKTFERSTLQELTFEKSKMKGPPTVEKPKNSGLSTLEKPKVNRPSMLEKAKIKGPRKLEKQNMIVPSTLEKPRKKSPSTLEKTKFRVLIGRPMFKGTSVIQGPKSNVPRVPNVRETNSLRISNFSGATDVREIKVSRASNYCETNVTGAPNGSETNAQGASIASNIREIKLQCTTSVPGTYFQKTISGSENTSDVSEAGPIRRSNSDEIRCRRLIMCHILELKHYMTRSSSVDTLSELDGDDIELKNYMTRSISVKTLAELDGDDIFSEFRGDLPNKFSKMKCDNFKQMLETNSPSKKFCHEIEPVCQHIDGNNQPNANKASSGTADVTDGSNYCETNVPGVPNDREKNVPGTSNDRETDAFVTSNDLDTNVPGSSNDRETNVNGTSRDVETNIPGTSHDLETCVPVASNDRETNVTGAPNDRETNVPGTSHDVETNVPGTSNDRETNVPGTSNVQDISIPEAAYNPETNVSGAPNDRETNVPGTSSDLDTNFSETSNDRETNVPETSDDLNINVSGASSDRETYVPGASNDHETNVLGASNDRETNVTGVTNDRERNVPGTSNDRETDASVASNDLDTNVPGTSNDLETNVSETSYDREANVSETSNNLNINVPGASNNRETNVLAAPCNRETNVPATSRDLETSFPENSNDRETNVPRTSDDLETNVPGASNYLLEKSSPSKKFSYEIEPICQHIGGNDQPNANKATFSTADVQNTSGLSQQNRTRNWRLRSRKNHCSHYPNVCPCKKSSENLREKSFSDPNRYRQLEDCGIADFRTQQKVFDYSLKRKVPKNGLISVKELNQIRKVCMQGAVAEKQKENISIIRRTSSKRKRIQQVKRERQQLRQVDKADVTVVSNKIDCLREKELIGIKWAGDWKKRLDVNRNLLAKMIRREEEILQYFVTEGIIGYSFRRKSQDTLIQYMFDIVIESGEKGYKCFLKALRDTNQDHVIQLLEVEDFKLNVSHRAAIRTNLSILVEQLPTDCGLLDYLIQENLLSKEEIQTINHQPTPSMKNRQLLDYMYRSSIEQFELFRNAIRGASSEHISDILELR